MPTTGSQSERPKTLPAYFGRLLCHRVFFLDILPLRKWRYLRCILVVWHPDGGYFQNSRREFLGWFYMGTYFLTTVSVIHNHVPLMCHRLEDNNKSRTSTSLFVQGTATRRLQLGNNKTQSPSILKLIIG